MNMPLQTRAYEYHYQRMDTSSGEGGEGEQDGEEGVEDEEEGNALERNSCAANKGAASRLNRLSLVINQRLTTTMSPPPGYDAQAAPNPKKRFGVRHQQSILLFLLLLFCNALRTNLSVGIVAMTDRTTNEHFETYKWDEEIKSLILSSFFWGYIVTQIPAGQMAKRFGPKVLLSCSFGLCSALALLTHVAAHYGGWKWMCALRVLQGLTQGTIFPSTHTLLSKWVPPGERARLSTFVYSGQAIGNVVMLAVSGIIASSSIGWPGIFYISGGCGLLWTVAWIFLGSNSPEVDLRISDEEKEYIQASLGQITDVEELKSLKTPWKSILTSVPFISIIIVHCAQNWGFYTLLTEIPTYLNYVMKFNIKDNALLSSLPYLVMFILSLSLSVLSDNLLKRKILNVAQCRKIFNSIGFYLPMVALIGLGYVSSDQPKTAIVLLVLSVGLNGAMYVGFMLNHMDLSPVYAGTLMGITNCISNIMSILGPLFVGVIVTDTSDVSLWRIVFFVASGIYLVGNTIFVLLGSGEIQPWNYADRQEPEARKINVASRSISNENITA